MVGLCFSVVAPLKLNLGVGGGEGLKKRVLQACQSGGCGTPFDSAPPPPERREEGKELGEEKDKKTKPLKGPGKHRER